jgi:hypothetical protein
MKLCNQPVGRGTVGDNRRCGALVVEGYTICAAHLAAARAAERWTADELERRFAERGERLEDAGE